MSKYGLQASEIEAISKVLQAHPEVEQGILYGSRAKGNYKPASDIDLTLQGNLLSLHVLQAIETELDDLLLPYKFDISIFHKISNTSLIAHIERIGKVLYSKKA
ncbi:MAG TPA: nucleotidyltransferase domain-containing protein [Flavisolibacter sp.]|nr:nucleotidyltransferase domain-containing protein [Flavisolibacter sp.]